MILDWIFNRLRRADRYDDPKETEKNMGVYGGGESGADSNGWKQDVAMSKNGEPQPAPAPMRQTETGMVREPTPDPYKDPKAPTLKNFGHQ